MYLMRTARVPPPMRPMRNPRVPSPMRLMRPPRVPRAYSQAMNSTIANSDTRALVARVLISFYSIGASRDTSARTRTHTRHLELHLRTFIVLLRPERKANLRLLTPGLLDKLQTPVFVFTQVLRVMDTIIGSR